MVQVIRSKCCNVIFAAAVEPHCYTDNDWLKNLKKYVEAGHKIEMIDKKDLSQFGKCECAEQAKKQQAKLF